jgi:XTP/dITP diphosphohydrolase
MSEPNRAPIALVLGTRNRKKGQEMIELLRPPWEPSVWLDRLAVTTLDEHPGVPDVVEDGATFAANAQKKASETARALGRWVLADDSGLAVDALSGAPGVFSARYAGTQGDDEANNRKLLAELAAVPDDRRGAAFICTLALADPTGAIRAESAGACRGRIIQQARGRNGFGYDPLFLIAEYHQTFGELSTLVKHQLSHRSRAFAHIRPTLERLIASGCLEAQHQNASAPG